MKERDKDDAVRRLVEHMVFVVPPVVGKNTLSTLALVTHLPIYEREVLDVEAGYLSLGTFLIASRYQSPKK